MKIVSACFVLVDKVLLQLRTPTNNKSFIVRVVKVCKRLIKWAMHAMHDNNCILSLWVISKSVNIRFDSILFYVWHSCEFCFEAKTLWKVINFSELELKSGFYPWKGAWSSWNTPQRVTNGRSFTSDHIFRSKNHTISPIVIGTT